MLVLFLELDIKIVFLSLVDCLLLVALKVVGDIGIDAGLRDDFILAHVALIACE